MSKTFHPNQQTQPIQITAVQHTFAQYRSRCSTDADMLRQSAHQPKALSVWTWCGTGTQHLLKSVSTIICQWLRTSTTWSMRVQTPSQNCRSSSGVAHRTDSKNNIHQSPTLQHVLSPRKVTTAQKHAHHQTLTTHTPRVTILVLFRMHRAITTAEHHQCRGKRQKVSQCRPQNCATPTPMVQPKTVHAHSAKP